MIYDFIVNSFSAFVNKYRRMDCFFDVPLTHIDFFSVRNHTDTATVLTIVIRP